VDRKKAWPMKKRETETGNKDEREKKNTMENLREDGKVNHLNDDDGKRRRGRNDE
jgi:hypothetical protein